MMGDQRGEVALMAGGSHLPGIHDPATGKDTAATTDVAVQGWFARKLFDGELALQGFVGTNGAGGGAKYRWQGQLGLLRAGLDMEVGWAWGGAGVPLSYELGDALWLYSRPFIGYYHPVGPGAALPLGIAFRIGNAGVFVMEVNGRFLAAAASAAAPEIRARDWAVSAGGGFILRL